MQCFFPLPVPCSPSWAGSCRHCPQSSHPHPSSSKGFCSHHCPSAAPGVWGLPLGIRGSHHASACGGEGEGSGSDLKIPPLSPGSSRCPVLTAQHGDSRSSQTVLCQQQTNWDCYLLYLICQGSCLTQALIIILIYFLPDVPRARGRAMSLWELLL